MNVMLRGIVENHNLFSNHYLENILPTLPVWSRDDHTRDFDRFRQRYAAEKPFRPDLNESQLGDQEGAAPD